MDSTSEPVLVLGSLALTVAGLGCIALIVAFLFTPFRDLWFVFLSRQRMGSYTRRLKAIDEYLELDAFAEATTLLEKSLFFQEGRCSPDQLELILQHNLGVLARVVMIAEHQNAQLRHLPVVEGLIQARHELLVTLEQARQSSRILKSSTAEPFDVTQHRLMERLVANRRGLNGQFDELLGELRSTGSEKERVIIH